MTYLITFTCYGCHLHGEQSGSVDRKHNRFGSRLLEQTLERVTAERRRMNEAIYRLDRERRDVVSDAIREVCAWRGWMLLASHVRTTHVHTVVGAQVAPERVMNDFKTYASRRLTALGLDQPGRKRWARHGSTRWLWEKRDVSSAIKYVVDGQGVPMSVYLAPDT